MNMSGQGQEWSDSEVHQLRQMWLAKTAEGKDEFSTSAMSRALGRSGSSVVGKAHRIGLPGRPNPSKPRGDKPLVDRRRTERAPKVTLDLAKPPESTPQPQPLPRSVSCCWPLGDPGTKSFRFCDERAVDGKPYCPDHNKLAFIKILHD